MRNKNNSNPNQHSRDNNFQTDRDRIVFHKPIQEIDRNSQQEKIKIFKKNIEDRASENLSRVNGFHISKE